MSRYRNIYRPFPPLSLEEIWKVSRATVSALSARGLECCLTGGAGCSAFGAPRVPNDVDVVVLSQSLSQEAVKNLLVLQDSNFFLVNSTNPHATYRVLWYRLPGQIFLYDARRCKVDILLPGTLNIPFIPAEQIRYPLGIDLPVMPLAALLPLKLQAWEHHRTATRADLVAKERTDFNDIKELLKIVTEAKVRFKSRRLSWLPLEFLREARERTMTFMLYDYGTTSERSESRRKWIEVGLADR